MNQMCIYTTSPRRPGLHEHCASSSGPGDSGEASIAAKGIDG